VLLVIDHQRRFDRFHRAVAEYVRSGKLGRIQLATSYYIAGIANTGTHLLDLLRFMFGDAEWVQAVSSRNVSPNPADPNLDAWVQFRDGPLAVLQACDVKDFAIFETTVIGSAGRLRIARHGSDLVYEEARPSHRFAEYKELYPALPPVDPGDETREYMLQALAHLLECLREKRPPLSSGEDGRATLELIQALRESADCGGRRVEIR
jgi:predicted dehydrogenase